ncbi:cytochrome b [Hyphomicrobium sp.]|jgi:cytochrome b561|uniref:cytochrome b n=1 Tax=Hyphomicrobium sp. TaxID=82 RepID=UPI002B53AF59|nr:cytochrome b/b6 domain-containing protein [Hyphomicrobium sp.]HVZ05747.1 cytochrome b/b6 domain-containing protein [Hyphomicrobium sp.]
MTIALHWLTAALVLTLFILSQTWGFLEKADRAPLKLTHTTLGAALVAVIIIRIAWRLFFGNRVVAANTGLMDVAAKLGHVLLYILVALQLWLGFLIGWSGKKASLNTFFGEIPSPFAAFTREDHHFFEETHGLIGWSIIILATAHALAALFHQYVLKDNVLSRMLPQREG